MRIAARSQGALMALEPVKQRTSAEAPTDPSAVPFPIPEWSTFWSLPEGEQRRLMDDLEAFHRELPALLAAGQAGRFALIKGGQLSGVWDTQDAALEAA